MGLENFDKISPKDQADITKHDIKRQAFHPDKGARDTIKVDRGPKGYGEITDDIENDEFVNANDKEKFVLVEEVGDVDVVKESEDVEEEVGV